MEHLKKTPHEALQDALSELGYDDESPAAWFKVGLCWKAVGDKQQAKDAFEKVLDIDPFNVEAEVKIGWLLFETGEIEDAIDRFESALLDEDDNLNALIGLSNCLVKQDDKEQYEQELSILKKIENLTGFNVSQNIRYANINYHFNRPHTAIRYWRKAMTPDKEHAPKLWRGEKPSSENPAIRFNLGLGYNHELISQDSDAIDMWRIALHYNPDYSPSIKMIEKTLPRLKSLAEKVRSESNRYLPKEFWYNTYTNPFELLAAGDEISLEELDTKKLQRLKKNLIQEIELEEGKISWLENIHVDKSFAISLCDELNDPKKFQRHLIIFKNKPLLEFLTKGSYEHFLVSENSSELETILYLENDSNFLEWLGGIFSNQFDRLLTDSISSRRISTIECLLDGRRWIPESMEDLCFTNAKKSLKKLLTPLTDLEEKSEKKLVSIDDLNQVLEYSSVLSILNLLPVFFEEEQNQAVGILRNLAINANNIHGDTELAKKIIEKAKLFKFRSPSINKKIDEDYKTIQELINEERKDEAKLTSGTTIWHITKEGVRLGDVFIPTNIVKSIVFGVDSPKSRSNLTWTFRLSFISNDNKKVEYKWNSSLEKIEENEKHYKKLISATLIYIAPNLLKTTIKSMEDGATIQMGPCLLSNDGISFEKTGWFFTKKHFIEWYHVKTKVEDGILSIYDRRSPSISINITIATTENSFLVSFISDIKKEGK